MEPLSTFVYLEEQNLSNQRLGLQLYIYCFILEVGINKKKNNKIQLHINIEIAQNWSLEKSTGFCQDSGYATENLSCPCKTEVTYCYDIIVEKNKTSDQCLHKDLPLCNLVSKMCNSVSKNVAWIHLVNWETIFLMSSKICLKTVVIMCLPKRCENVF